MKIDELNHVALHVTDLEASMRFYREILELPLLPRPDFSFPGAWFRLGAVQELHLIAERMARPLDEASRPGHFALRVPDIAAAEQHLRRKGVAFRGPMLRPDGARQIFFEDPDGHLVEFCCVS